MCTIFLSSRSPRYVIRDQHGVRNGNDQVSALHIQLYLCGEYERSATRMYVRDDVDNVAINRHDGDAPALRLRY